MLPTKKNNIVVNRSKISCADIEEEVSKCILLCVNCERIYTREERGYISSVTNIDELDADF